MKPVLLIIGGPNGSGKTTITTRLRNERWSHGVEYLNPDDVARDRFGDWNAPAAVLAAARWTTERREALLSERSGIAFETVLSAPDKIAFMERAKAAGYFVRLFFVGTRDPRINAARVAGRVMQGGHTVPIEKIVTRFTRSNANLTRAIPLANRVYVYDNSVDDQDAFLCARTREGAMRKIYGDLPDWVTDAIADVPLDPELIDLRAAARG